MPGLSRYEQHVERWSSGCGSTMCQYANRICYGRGTIPCNVVFIGEAPGESENCIGEPFVGPAGFELNRWIEAAIPPTVTYALTNLVGCLPRDPETGSKAQLPVHEDVLQCSDRLLEFIRIANPNLIVLVGKQAEHYFTKGYRDCLFPDLDIPTIEVSHPSYVLRQPPAKRQQIVPRAIIRIRDAVIEHVLNLIDEQPIEEGEPEVS